MMDAALERTRTGAEVAEDLATDLVQQRRLAAYARSRFGIDAAESEDLVQETIVELLRCNSAILHANGFVFRVFHLRCCARTEQDVRFRSVRSRTRSADRLEPAVEDHVLLREGFSRISPSCQRLLRAYYLEGKSLKETALESSLASSGVWKLINRCLQRLKLCLS
jgi:RNA polymerase sigma factor (sigma-70 family)